MYYKQADYADKCHYKGNLEFFFYKTNQQKIVKDFLKLTVPDEIRKSAKKLKLSEISEDVINDAKKELSNFINLANPNIFCNLFRKNNDKSIAVFHLLNNCLDLISGTDYFDIKAHLALMILQKTIKPF
jgi:hypothetical protein